MPFHPEVTSAQVEDFIERRSAELSDPAAARGRWNDLGRTLCGAFLDEGAGD